MEKMRTKYAVLGLVFMLSVVFFWLAINRYLLPSKAQLASNMQIVPHATSIECNPQGECYLHVLGSVGANSAVSGVSGKIVYSDNLEPVRLDSIGICQQSTYGLDQYLQFQDDKTTKTVTFSVSTVKTDNEIKGGNGCIVTVVFKPVNVTTDPQQSKMVLGDSALWKVAGTTNGQRGTLSAQVDTSTILVKITSSSPWPPPDQATGTPAPTITKTPGCDLSKADCNCDQKVDMLDWETIRSYYQAEGKVCDVDADGKADREFTVWLRNNGLIR
ncbi:hypothetical protein A3I56_00535 [Candidatus Roizmanbacteria bacterium RIFCSPLOWO2_02_FULL_43_10]|uniref:Dockerin domain-containing protein n=1 Tax=Candidatus Roizmanbacteria bacterium RIFCSPLOWO2_02_FULL_43_10 TaxID=1802078 RepID=A0A1F7K211_9BACT|nr:MAG: hypothetical protein A3I56_00535 [Candidatus Roizmanbacteria bacterium RIFCSPLOWO2_02_FULL_43_10]